MALVFTANSNAQDARVREALALSIDRKPIQFVLLKGAADPTASMLPNWMTGYSAAFPTQSDLPRAKALLADSRPRALTLSYDPRDPQSQLIAERIALNAREVGITVQVSMSGGDDIRLIRIALVTPDPALALRETARELSLPEPALRGNSVEDLYQAECSLLEGNGVIPLFHVPVATATGARVRGLESGSSWHLEPPRQLAGHSEGRGLAMSFRQKLLILFATTILLCVAVMSVSVYGTMRRSFEQANQDRANAIAAEFRSEFQRRGQEVARKVESVAASESVQRIALDINRAPDLRRISRRSPHVSRAAATRLPRTRRPSRNHSLVRSMAGEVWI